VLGQRVGVVAVAGGAALAPEGEVEVAKELLAAAAVTLGVIVGGGRADALFLLAVAD
jgi:hypothetical protein